MSCLRQDTLTVFLFLMFDPSDCSQRGLVIVFFLYEVRYIHQDAKACPMFLPMLPVPVTGGYHLMTLQSLHDTIVCKESGVRRHGVWQVINRYQKQQWADDSALGHPAYYWHLEAPSTTIC